MMNLTSNVNGVIQFFTLCGLLFSVFIGGPQIGAVESAQDIWKNMKHGPYAIGYQVKHVYDYSRSFAPTLNYLGNRNSGEQARPIQISIWYPAITSENPDYMKYEDYIQYISSEVKFEYQTEIRKKWSVDEWRELNESFGLPAEALNSALSALMTATESSKPQEGKFPLILYAPSIDASPYENVILIEFLVSHGYIVASSPSSGVFSQRMTNDWAGLEAQVRDVEFVLAFMRDYPNINYEKIGAFGFSWGGMAVSLLAVRNYNIDAVICMDGGTVFGFNGNTWKDYDYYNPQKVRAPFMFMASAPYEKDEEWEFLDGVKYADSYLLHFHGLAHPNFSSLANINRLYLLRFLMQNKDNQNIASRTYREQSGNILKPPKDILEIEKDRVIVDYQNVSNYCLNFFNSYLMNDANGKTFIQNSPKDNKISSKALTATFRKGLRIPPTEIEFVELVQKQGVAKAVELYEQYLERDSQLVMFSENTMNQLGYAYLNAKFINDAIELFKLNVRAYPDSWNVFDSLGEAYMNNGNVKEAIINYRKSLEINPDNANGKTMLRRLGERL